MKNINLGLNTRIFELKESVITNLPDQLQYLRAFGVDFKKIKDNDGLLQKPDESRIDDFVKLVTERNLKVIWVPFITKDGRTLQREIDFVKELKERGVVFHAFQMLGEFYLPKYYYADLNAKGVVEGIRKEELAAILDIWVNAFQSEFPESKTFITCASHQNGNSRAEKYRKSFTNSILTWAKNREYDGEFCFHMYSGYKGQEGGNEEAIYTDIDFSHITGQIKDKFPETPIHLCEGGYYRKDDTEIPKMIDFMEQAQQALGKDSIVSLHLLQGSGEFAWFDRQGATIVGDAFIAALEQPDEPIEEPEPPINEAPTLVSVIPDAKGQFVMYGFTYLTFSDGSERKITTRFGYRPFGRDDIGKTIDELK